MKTTLLIFCLSLARTLSQNVGSGRFDCSTLKPDLASLKSKEPSPADTNPYAILMEHSTIQPGQTLRVVLQVKQDHTTINEITGFVLQMREVTSDPNLPVRRTPIGTWSLPRESSDNTHIQRAKIQSCDTGTDDELPNAAVSSGFLGVRAVELDWTPPSPFPAAVQLVGAVIDGGAQEYWMLDNQEWRVEIKHPDILEENVETEPEDVVKVENEPTDDDTQQQEEDNEEEQHEQVPLADLDAQVTSTDKEDEHDLIEETRLEKEYLEQKAKDIAMENLATETDAMKELDNEKLKHDEEVKWEMEDFEKKAYDEELRRQARIEAELRDKEEWETQNARRLEEERRQEQLRKEMLENTDDEIDINKILKDIKKTAGAGVLTSSLCLLFITFIINRLL